MKLNNILEDAQLAPNKSSIEEHKEAILILRSKKFTWREIADFLIERGVQTDHTQVYRLISKTKNRSETMSFPNADAYKKALTEIKISKDQMNMLEKHYKALNRSSTYTQLAEVAGSEHHGIADSQYGKLGHALGDALNFEFFIHEGKPWFSSSIGMENAYTKGNGDFQIVMHHELAKAIKDLGWFE